MNETSVDRFIRRAQALALVGLPLLWMLMIALHFRALGDFFVFHERYVPRPAADTVTRLIEARNLWPMIHDPHLIGYLTLPLLVLGAFGLYRIGRHIRPGIASLGVSLTAMGSIYLGGL